MPMTDDDLMACALAEARKAETLDEVPIGAVVALPGDAGWRVIGRGHNRREIDQDPTAHAELIAIREASRTLGFWRLDGAVLAVTLEPCAMCAGAIVLARIARIVYGAADPKGGACGTLFEIPTDPRLNHRVEVQGGVRAAECGSLLTAFFRRLRGQAEVFDPPDPA